MEHPFRRVLHELSPEDQARLAVIMARNSLSDDDAVLLVIAECLLIMIGMRKLINEEKELVQQTRESAKICVNAALACQDAMKDMQSHLSNPALAARANKLFSDANSVIRQQITNLDREMTKAMRPRWFFVLAGLVGALSVAGPLWWRLDDLRQSNVVYLSTQGGRVDQCTIPQGTPVQHDARHGRYLFCLEKTPLK